MDSNTADGGTERRHGSFKARRRGEWIDNEADEGRLLSREPLLEFRLRRTAQKQKRPLKAIPVANASSIQSTCV